MNDTVVSVRGLEKTYKVHERETGVGATVRSFFNRKFKDVPAVGGIDFNEDDQPDYIDFAYVALTIGMTYQVSDTNLQAKLIRRAAVRHALISWMFGVVIIAITINIVASLAH
jgi:uncharacterized membrane protein